MPAPCSVPTLSREEMKTRALAFAKRWEGNQREEADAKSFLDEFFQVFGRDRKAVEAEHEFRIPRADRGEGRIDLFWPGILLVEMKSSGKDLSTSKGGAACQAFEYLEHLDPEDVPRWVLVSNFGHFALYDLGEKVHEFLKGMASKAGKKPELVASFALEQFPDKLRHFAFIRDEEQELFQTHPEANLKAVKRLGFLHDSLKKSGYQGHALERLLVRVLFCLFAQYTDIFPWNSFTRFVRQSKRDGSDLGLRLGKLFDVLDTAENKRTAHLSAEFKVFPYVNGGLFAERLSSADTTEDDRLALIHCCEFDWSKISPGIFGSLFQGVMEPAERRAKGAHYTSEENILRVLNPLFMDDLRAEFAQIKTAAVSREKKLTTFHDRLSKLRLLDPACGCGNFLVVAYRELRALELEVLKAIYGTQLSLGLDIADLARLNVDQCFGIEIEEFPALIAETALWLTDHQVNMTFAKAFGQHFARIPLKKSPTIVHGNALRTDWEKVLPPKECSYVLGNPPFIGSKFMTSEQTEDMTKIAGRIGSHGVLDYVSAWYLKAAAYIQKTDIRCAFVSTNSITQGEQVSVLWSALFKQSVKLHFAHRTFVWGNEASGKAHVHVVIIGFGLKDIPNKTLFSYDENGVQAVEKSHLPLGPYLFFGGMTLVSSRSGPLCAVPSIDNGSIPADGGNLLFDAASKTEFLEREPKAAKWIRPYLGAESFLHDQERHCLWLKNCLPHELLAMPEVLKRVEAVRDMRLASAKEATRKKAESPTRFTEDRQPASGNYLALPRTSSETRRYIPIGFLSSEIIAANDLQIIPNATPYVFGIVTSMMHMAWMQITSGRLESRYRYSVKLTYNTFPWPEPDAKQRAAVESAAQAVLDTRKPYREAGSTLADLYDRRAMPLELTKAHQTLDRAVDRCYRNPPFTTDRERVEFLFALYEKLTDPLLPANRKTVSYKGPKKKSPRPNPHMGFQAATDADDGHMDTVMEEASPYTAK